MARLVPLRLLWILLLVLASGCGSGTFLPGADPVVPPDAGPRPLEAHEERLVGLYELVDLRLQRGGVTRQAAALRPWSGMLELLADRTGSFVIEIEGTESSGASSNWFATSTLLFLGFAPPLAPSPQWRFDADGLLLLAIDREGTDYDAYTWQRVE